MRDAEVVIHACNPCCEWKARAEVGERTGERLGLWLELQSLPAVTPPWFRVS